MSISEPFIRRPIGTSLLMLGVLVFGIGAYNLLPVPNTRTPSISSEVPIGRRMNGSEMLIGVCPLFCSRFQVSQPRQRAFPSDDRDHQAPRDERPGCRPLPPGG